MAGAAVAGYTAFLFAQCEGRDLWQTKLLLPHLLVQAVLCGAVVLIPFEQRHGPLSIIAAVAALAFAVEKMAGVPPEQDPTEPQVGDAAHGDEAKARIEKAGGAKSEVHSHA